MGKVAIKPMRGCSRHYKIEKRFWKEIVEYILS